MGLFFPHFTHWIYIHFKLISVLIGYEMRKNSLHTVTKTKKALVLGSNDSSKFDTFGLIKFSKTVCRVTRQQCSLKATPLCH